MPDASVETFHVTVLGPLTGVLGLYAAQSLIVTIQPAPIPEPSTVLLLGLGLAVMTIRKRR